MKEKTQIMDQKAMGRAIARISYEIIERNRGLAGVCVVGILRRGAVVAARLADKVHSRGDHLATGFVGTPLLLQALDEAGHTELAFKLLLNETFPSWGYPIVKGGATTMWERWDGWHHERGFGDAGMNSFNHYAYGAVGEWMQRRVAGLQWDASAPGGGRFVVDPAQDGRLSWARASWMSPRGRASVSWKREGGAYSLEAAIPPSSRARIILPAPEAGQIREGGQALAAGNGVLSFGPHGAGQTAVEVESGEYRFDVRA